MEYIKTTKGQPCLIYQGFRYTTLLVKVGGDIRWRCVKRECKGQLITRDGGVIKEEKHLCVPDTAGNEVFKATEKAKKRAREEVETPISKIEMVK
jgi:hypothetical protein